MSLIKRINVKSYLSTRRHTGIHAVQIPIKVAEAGLPLTGVTVEKMQDTGFASDFSLEHCSPGGTVTSVVMIAASVENETPRTSDNTQA
jgi:hypothetical protein